MQQRRRRRRWRCSHHVYDQTLAVDAAGHEAKAPIGTIGRVAVAAAVVVAAVRPPLLRLLLQRLVLLSALLRRARAPTALRIPSPA